MNEISESQASQRPMAWMWVVWPSFLTACLLEMLTFAAIDPRSLAITHAPHNWSARTVYSVSFMVFWGITFLSSSLTAWLSNSALKGQA